MKHMCMMLAEQANTSHVTYTLHHTTPNGQYPEAQSIIIINGPDKIREAFLYTHIYIPIVFSITPFKKQRGVRKKIAKKKKFP